MALSEAVQRSRRRRLRRSLEKAKARAGPPPDPTFWWSPRLRGLASGNLDKPFAEHPWVFRAVSVISDALVSMPVRLYTGDAEAPREVDSGPWFEFFDNPCPGLDPAQFWALSSAHLLLPGGECFWVLHGRDGRPLTRPKEMPEEAWPYSGTEFEELEDQGRFVGWRHTRKDGARMDLLPWQVVHFALPNPYAPRRGLSPVDAAMRSVRTDHKAHLWNEAALDNNAEPDGVLTQKGNGAVPLNPDQQRNLREQWNDRHQGPGKAKRIAVLPNNLEWQSTGMSPKDMEFQLQREWSRQEVAAAFGVPLFLLTVLGDVHRETSRETLKLFYMNTVLPHGDRFERGVNRQLFRVRGEDGLWLQFDASNVDALQRGESERVEQAKGLWSMGVNFRELNRRFELGVEEFEGDDVGFVPAAVQPLILVDDEPEEPEPPPQAPPPDEKDDEAEAESEPDDEEGDGRAAPASRARNIDRWRAYVNNIQGPRERRARRALKTWLRKRRKEVLAFVGTGRSARDLQPGDVDAWLEGKREEWQEQFSDALMPVVEDTVEATIERLGGQIGKLTVIDMGHPAILDHLATMEDRMVLPPETIRKHIRAQLLESVAAGENVTVSQDRVRTLFNAANHRTLTIARTEIGMASQGAAFSGMKAEGVTKIEWISAGDSEVRDSHIEANGKVIVIGDTFPNGLRYPLDSSGPAREVINCRCDIAPVVEEDTGE